MLCIASTRAAAASRMRHHICRLIVELTAFSIFAEAWRPETADSRWESIAVAASYKQVTGAAEKAYDAFLQQETRPPDEDAVSLKAPQSAEEGAKAADSFLQREAGPPSEAAGAGESPRVDAKAPESHDAFLQQEARPPGADAKDQLKKKEKASEPYDAFLQQEVGSPDEYERGEAAGVKLREDVEEGKVNDFKKVLEENRPENAEMAMLEGVDAHDREALHLAAETGNMAMVVMLLRADLRLGSRFINDQLEAEDDKKPRGETPGDLAKEKGYMKIANLLEKLHKATAAIRKNDDPDDAFYAEKSKLGRMINDAAKEQ
eukprot:TRINITY_DN15244_c0_g1_i1.p1 TRINITY_DN15244_c0_g1~~TRINITY_DN15244_c0_g1_i1.p1  ORF type:complete len:319 (+),score=76.78 TRINITY_DN15244_c0_g1_i1:780-1736(+)